MQLAMEYREALNVEARQVVDIIDSMATRGVGAKTSWQEMVRLLDEAGSTGHFRQSTRTAAQGQQQEQQQPSRAVTPLVHLSTPSASRAEIFSVQSSPDGPRKEMPKETRQEGGAHKVRLTPFVDPLAMRTRPNHQQQQQQQQQQQRPMTRGSGHVNPFEERREQLERLSISRQSLGSRRGNRGL
jgi:hypothetical protein